MSEDFRDMFSMRGAYVDNDGTLPGDNLCGAPDAGFKSSEYESPTQYANIHNVSGRWNMCALWISLGVGGALALAIIAASLATLTR